MDRSCPQRVGIAFAPLVGRVGRTGLPLCIGERCRGGDTFLSGSETKLSPPSAYVASALLRSGARRKQGDCRSEAMDQGAVRVHRRGRSDLSPRTTGPEEYELFDSA